MAPKGKSDDVLYIGIDLGTSHTAVSASNGVRKTFYSLVGWPKDVVAKKFIKSEMVFGEEVRKNRLALNVIRPMENGVIIGSGKSGGKDVTEEEAERAMHGAKELVKYAIDLAETRGYPKLYGVIGAPSKASKANKQALVEAANEILDAVMVVPEPFAVAYGANKLNISIVIDMGAGTVDLCRIYGALPTEDDQRVTYKAGDFVDNKLLELIKDRYEGAQITKDMARKWKEQYAYVGDTKKNIVVEFPIEGVPQKFDITKEMRSACEAVIPDIMDSIREVVSTFHPEFQDELRNNVILAGGSAQISDLDKVLEEEMDAIGGGMISVADDPVYAGADGSLKLAQDMPEDYWNQLL